MIHLGYPLLFSILLFRVLGVFRLPEILSRIVKTIIQNRKFTILDTTLSFSYIVKL